MLALTLVSLGPQFFHLYNIGKWRWDLVDTSVICTLGVHGEFHSEQKKGARV